MEDERWEIMDVSEIQQSAGRRIPERNANQIVARALVDRESLSVTRPDVLIGAP
jgi:hypothetical protein